MRYMTILRESVLRFICVLRADLFSRYRFFWSFSMTLFGVVLLLALINGRSINENFYLSLYGIVAIAGTAIVASGSFKDVFKSSVVHDWLLLPAATYEKVLSRLMLTFPAFVILLNLIFFAASLGAFLWFLLLHHETTVLFVPFSPEAMSIVPHLLVAHSLFFFGSSLFRKSAFFKTSLCLVVLFLSAFIFGSLFLVKMLGNMDFNAVSGSIHFSFPGGQGKTTTASGDLHMISDSLNYLLNVLYFWVLPLVFWLVPFLRMRKMEAHRAL